LGRALSQARQLRWRRHEAAIAIGLAALVMVLASGLPLVQLAFQLGAVGAEGLRILGTARPWRLLGQSLALAGAVTAASLAAGVPLGILVARTDLAGRRLVWALHAFPFALPPFLLALGWFQALGRQGFMGGETTAGLLFGWAGAIWVLAFAFAPVVTSLVAVGLMGVDVAQEEAARVVARPSRVLVRILLPAVAPAIVLGALLAFVLTVSELGVPTFLRVDVFPAAVFARLGGVDYAPGEAFGLVLPLIPLVAVLVLVERRFVGPRSFAVLGLRGGSRTPLPLGRWRWPLSVAAWAVALTGLLPIGALALRAARGTSMSVILGWARAAPFNGLLVSAAAATIVTVMALVAGQALARGHRSGKALDTLSVLAFIMPAAVLGVGLISVWNRPLTAGLYSSVAIIVVGFIARYAAVGLRTCAVALRQVSPTLEEAAATTGARYGRRLLRIVVPTARRGIGFAWLATFVFCLRDLETAILYYPPGREPLTVRIFTLEANGPEPVVAGLACLHVLVTAAVMGAGTWFLKRGSPA
jgi:iron(III) transport system permease protein